MGVGEGRALGAGLALGRVRRVGIVEGEADWAERRWVELEDALGAEPSVDAT